MIKKCKNDCVAVCGFCLRYGEDNKCKYSNKIKEKYNDCDCDMFKCFTLASNYKDEDYLTAKYIKQLFEGDII